MREYLLLCDPDTWYVKELAQFLAQEYENQFQVVGFDQAEKLMVYLEKHEQSVCLVEETLLDAYQTEKLLQSCKKVIPLCKAKGKEGIFKYQPMTAISRAISEKLSEMTDILPPYAQTASKGAHMYAFYTPVRAIWQSNLAMTVGRALAKDKKVLYLNFEPYSGFEYVMQKKYEHDLMDLMFFLQEEDTKFSLRLRSMTETIDGLCYIPPVFCYPELWEIEADAWKKLLRRIQETTDYEIILLDLTETMQGLFQVLETCQLIFSFLPKDDGLAMAKMNQYKQLLQFLQKEKVTEKSQIIEIEKSDAIPTNSTAFLRSNFSVYTKDILQKIAQAEDRNK